eukprot:760871-Hanusia_phi.AAC.2
MQLQTSTHAAKLPASLPPSLCSHPSPLLSILSLPPLASPPLNSYFFASSARVYDPASRGKHRYCPHPACPSDEVEPTRSLFSPPLVFSCHPMILTGTSSFSTMARLEAAGNAVTILASAQSTIPLSRDVRPEVSYGCSDLPAM